MPVERKLEDVFLRYFHDNKDKVYNYALHMIGDSHSAGDITQDVFLRLFENRGKFAEIGNVTGWLITVARNRCLNHLRGRKKEVSIENIDLYKSDNPIGIDHNHATLEKAMAGLKTRYREALILREYQGCTYNEISEILQITVAAVRSLLYNARLELRDNFQRLNDGRQI